MTLKPPAPGANLAPGYRLDRYELLAPIATGGMASVWVGRQIGKHGFEKLVAIKTILPQYASDLRFQKMFLDEAHIASGIEHQNVAQILDLGEEHDVLYIVMEFVDGDALSKLNRACDKRGVKIPQGVLLRVLADACMGLHAAHELRDKEGTELNVVHRDVSPQNILVSAKGIAKVIDFGIAKARDRAAGDTGTGLLKGKIHYMPPEQALGKLVDRRADIWAIGAIIYHLLSGRLPFDAENQLATLHLLTSGRPPIPLPPSVPSAITKVVRRAMAFDMEKRFATSADLAQAIEEAMVEANLRATTQDVAAFLHLHLADRQEQRKQAVDLALKAAADRARMQQLLRPTSDSSSGVSNFNLKPMYEASNPGLGSASGAGTMPTSPSTPGALTGDQPSSPSSASNATLGSAAIEQAPSLGASRRKRGVLIVVALGGIIAAVTAGVVLGMNAKTSPTSAAPPQSTTGAATKIESTATTTTSGATSEPTSTGATASAEPSTAPTESSSAATQPTTSAKPYPTLKFPQGKWPTTKPTTTTSAAPTTTVKKKVDDGF